MDPLGVSAVEAINDNFGRHELTRAVHAKGAWCEGTFTGTPEGAALCRAPFLTGEPTPTLVRFSNGSGDPHAHDGVRDGRGMAVKLFLADGEVTDISSLSLAVFSSRTPEDFIELVRLSKRDPETGAPDLAKLGPYLEAHPETMGAIQSRMAMGPPASWLTLAYNGIHAFRWTAPDGEQHWVRTRWLPDDGVEELDDDDAMSRDPDYLTADLHDRLAAGSASFTLLARIAQEGDPLEDPTAAWPEEREAVAVGRLELEHAVPSPETPENIHVFDPLRLCDGIEPSDDPILHFRRRAYDVSARARWAGDGT